MYVQRGNVVVATSTKKSRIQSNFCLSELGQSDFDDIENIAQRLGQIRFGNWDELWGSNLFANEVLWRKQKMKPYKQKYKSFHFDDPFKKQAYWGFHVSCGR